MKNVRYERSNQCRLSPEKKYKKVPCMTFDKNILRICRLKELKSKVEEDPFYHLPCSEKFDLKAQEEISLDSIFSGLLNHIEPEHVQYKNLKWNLKTTDMHNEKQVMLFNEKLYVSLIKKPCQVFDKEKLFSERDLVHVGYWNLSIEEAYDGYVVVNQSELLKDKGSMTKCGHCLKGRYDNKFTLLVEKRKEYDIWQGTEISKIMESRFVNNTLYCNRTTIVRDEAVTDKTCINMKNRDYVFILDGGLMIAMRYLAINKHVGNYAYFTMNLSGHVLRGLLTFHEKRETITTFYQTFKNCQKVTNTIRKGEKIEQVSQTFYDSDGRIVLHYWEGYNYIVHKTRHPVKPKPNTMRLPKLELLWRSCNDMQSFFQKEKNANFKSAGRLLRKKTDLVDILHDYIYNIIQAKPDDAILFSIRYFRNVCERGKIYEREELMQEKMENAQTKKKTFVTTTDCKNLDAKNECNMPDPICKNNNKNEYAQSDSLESDEEY